LGYAVPFVDPREHYRRYKTEFDAALTETIARGDLVMRWRHAGLNLPPQSLPETKAICREVISLPMSAETTPEQVDEVVHAVREFWRQPRPGLAQAEAGQGASSQIG
jgi:dTDP-4-amino-4,6-dideoxygalactose transaminase